MTPPDSLLEVIASFPEQSAILIFRTVRHLHLAFHLRPDQLGAVTFGVVATCSIAAYVLYNRRPSAEEVERQRREFLATSGRITDATLIDTGLDRRLETEQNDLRTEDSPPDVLRYQYKVAGVGYESLQDVARLPEFVRHLRVDLPIQVRYDPKNPGNSIVVAESWSGLRMSMRTGTGKPSLHETDSSE